LASKLSIIIVIKLEMVAAVEEAAVVGMALVRTLLMWMAKVI
jgi:hypothetical protein